MDALIERMKRPTLEFLYSLKKDVQMEKVNDYLKKLRQTLREELQEQIKNSNFIKRTFFKVAYERVDEIIGNIYDCMLDSNSIPAVDAGFWRITEDIHLDENFIINVLTKITVYDKSLNIWIADYFEESTKLVLIDPIRNIDKNDNQERLLASMREAMHHFETLFKPSKDESSSTDEYSSTDESSCRDEPLRKRKRKY